MHAEFNFPLHFFKKRSFLRQQMALEIPPCQHSAQTAAHGEHRVGVFERLRKECRAEKKKHEGKKQEIEEKKSRNKEMRGHEDGRGGGALYTHRAFSTRFYESS